MDNNYLCVIFHCNEWQEYSSFRFVGVVEEKELPNAIQLLKEDWHYNDEDIDKHVFIYHVVLNELDT